MLSGVPDITQITLVALLLTIILTVFRARWLARRYGEPIADLVAQTERMARLNFSREIPIESPILEVQRLASSQDAMRLALDGLSRMNDHGVIARELRRSPKEMLSIRAGTWELALWDEPAEQVGGCLPVVFPAVGKEAGEWALAREETWGGAVMVLASTQLRDMAAAKLGVSLRTMTRAILRLATTADGLHEAILGELTKGRTTTAPVSLISAFLDGEGNSVEIFRHGEVSVLYSNSAVAQAQWWDASEFGTRQLDQRLVIELQPGD